MTDHPQSPRVWRPRDVTRALLLILGFLILAHTAAYVSTHVFGHDHLWGLVPLFDVDQEFNVPTLFTCVLLVAGSVLFLAIGRTGPGDGRRVLWPGLALLFVFLAVDELAMVHERIGGPVRETLGTGGVLYWAWVIPYGVLVAAVTAAFLPTFLRLPRPVQRWLAAAALVFVTGALGLEMVEGWMAERAGAGGPVYALVAEVQEIMEMTGLILLIHGQLTLIALRLEGRTLEVRGGSLVGLPRMPSGPSHPRRGADVLDRGPVGAPPDAGARVDVVDQALERHDS